MQLNSRQMRVYTLIQLLGAGKPVPAQVILAALACSDPTLTRALKELKRTWSAEIKYSKASHSYQLVNPGLLDKKRLQQINVALALHEKSITAPSCSRVILDKHKKTAVSLSLRMSVVRKIDRLAELAETSRSETVEAIVEKSIDELILLYRASKITVSD